MQKAVSRAVIVALVVFLGATAAVAAAPEAKPTQLTTLEQSIRREINVVRAQYGLRPLAASPELTEAAEFYTRKMLRQGFFDHNSPSGVTFAQRIRSRYSPDGYARWAVGENLLSSPSKIDAKRAVELWMASPEHRDNMLSPTFRQMGIAAVHQKSAPGVFGGNEALVITLDLGLRQ